MRRGREWTAISILPIMLQRYGVISAYAIVVLYDVQSCPLRRANLTFTISKVLLYDVQSSASAILIVILSFCHFVKMRKRKCLSDSYSIIYIKYIIL